MSFIITSDSHTDHGLNEEHLDFLRKHFKRRNEFFIESCELPENLPALSCGLYGPIMGDVSVPEDVVVWETRGDRGYTSRMVDFPKRPTRIVTVIAGPHGDEPCILFTAYGGPLAPKGPNDPSRSSSEIEESEVFWAEHALSTE